MPVAIGGSCVSHCNGCFDIICPVIPAELIAALPGKARKAHLLKIRPHYADIARQPLGSLAIDPTTKRLSELSFEKVSIVSSTPSAVYPLTQDPGVGGADNSFQRAVQLLPKPLVSAVSNSSSLKLILSYLLCPNGPNHHGPGETQNSTQGYCIFEAITTEEYMAIAYLTQNTALSCARPKLTYTSSDRVLILQMPCSIHEMPLSDLRDYITKTVTNLLYDQDTICAQAEMNLVFKLLACKSVATADLSLCLLPLVGHISPQFPIIVESAFSQDRLHLWRKIKKEISACPEIVLLIATIVTESPNYTSPEEGSDAWNKFREEDTSRSSSDFLDLQDHSTTEETQSLCIQVTGHVWCSVTVADYYVWVKDAPDSIIDIDRMQAVCGTLYPLIEMEGVTQAIIRGLSKTRDAIVSLSHLLDPSIDTVELENANIPFSVSWKSIQLSLKYAVGITAHNHYETWHEDHFGSSGEEYEESEGSSGTSVSSTPIPLRRSPVRTRSQTRMIAK